MQDSQRHWDGVYQTKPFDAVSWYAPHLNESIQLIETLCPDLNSPKEDLAQKARAFNGMWVMSPNMNLGSKSSI